MVEEKNSRVLITVSGIGPSLATTARLFGTNAASKLTRVSTKDNSSMKLSNSDCPTLNSRARDGPLCRIVKVESPFLDARYVTFNFRSLNPSVVEDFLFLSQWDPHTLRIIRKVKEGSPQLEDFKTSQRQLMPNSLADGNADLLRIVVEFRCNDGKRKHIVLGLKAKVGLFDPLHFEVFAS